MTQATNQITRHIHAFLARHVAAQAARHDPRGHWAHIRCLAIHPLRESFNTATVRGHNKPAFELENLHGIHDISTQYTMLPGVSVRQLEAYCLAVSWLEHDGKLKSAKAQAYLTTLAQHMVALNPQLTSLRYNRNNQHQCYDVVLGMTSGFNRDDIQFFLDGNTYQKSMDTPAYAAQYNAAASKLHRDALGWVPSPQTLARIIAQEPAWVPSTPRLKSSGL